MSKINTKILHGLLNIGAPTNDESLIREFIKKQIPQHNKLTKISDLNTSLSYHLNIKKKKTILIDAHMDEIRGQIINITSEGFLTVNILGGLVEYMHGRPIVIYSSKVNKLVKGVTLIQHAHLKQLRQKYKNEYNKEILYADIGAESKASAMTKVEIGDYLIFDYKYRYLNKDIISARGLDNKLGVYVVIQLLTYFIKNITKLKYNLIISFSGDEESGKTSLSHLKKFKLDSIIVVDTDWSSDVPFINSDIYGSINIGAGAVITRGDEDDGLFIKFRDLSKKYKIPTQIVTNIAGGSMLSSYLTQYSTKTQFIGIPLRNIHSPVETANLKDCIHVFSILKKFLETI